jgi:hypothetical protein
MKFPKEIRYTLCAPNHCGDGSRLKLEIHGILSGFRVWDLGFGIWGLGFRV